MLGAVVLAFYSVLGINLFNSKQVPCIDAFLADDRSVRYTALQRRQTRDDKKENVPQRRKGDDVCFSTRVEIPCSWHVFVVVQ